MWISQPVRISIYIGIMQHNHRISTCIFFNCLSWISVLYFLLLWFAFPLCWFLFFIYIPGDEDYFILLALGLWVEITCACRSKSLSIYIERFCNFHCMLEDLSCHYHQDLLQSWPFPFLFYLLM